MNNKLIYSVRVSVDVNKIIEDLKLTNMINKSVLFSNAIENITDDEIRDNIYKKVFNEKKQNMSFSIDTHTKHLLKSKAKSNNISIARLVEIALFVEINKIKE